MAVTDAKLHPNSRTPIKSFVFNDALAINLTNVAVARFRPGFPFEIVDIRANARTVNAYTVPEVRIVNAAADTGQNVLTATLTPTAVATATPAGGALQANRTLRRGRATQEVILHLTTGATAPVNARVEIFYRPYPLNGEV